MNTHIFIALGAGRLGDVEGRVRTAVETIAQGTDTRGLVVAAYALGRRDFWHAHTYTRKMTSAVFRLTGRNWAFVRRFPVPGGLPARFPLIRMAFGMRDSFPRTIQDVYGWELRCERFEDLAAYTFAHELHHFRRYHLGLHPGEGEQTTCRWALAQAAEAGYRVTGRKHKCGRKPKPKKQLPLPQHFVDIRALPPGAELRLMRDSGRRSKYVGQRAVKVRTLRRNSYRVAVRTLDGRDWLWPMQWLEAVESKCSPRRHGEQQRIFLP